MHELNIKSNQNETSSKKSNFFSSNSAIAPNLNAINSYFSPVIMNSFQTLAHLKSKWLFSYFFSRHFMFVIRSLHRTHILVRSFSFSNFSATKIHFIHAKQHTRSISVNHIKQIVMVLSFEIFVTNVDLNIACCCCRFFPFSFLANKTLIYFVWNVTK